MQVAVYEWLEVLDMPKGDLRKFKADIMRVYYHPSGYIDGVGEKYDAVDTLNEKEYEDGLNGREWVRTEYRSRNYFRRLVSIARMACADHAGEIVNAADRGAANLSGAIKDLRKAIQAANLTGAPAPKQKPAGHEGGMSQADFAALLIHYGGKYDGKRYTARQIKTWDSKPEKRPTANGRKYTPELRRDILAARIWAKDFNRERENAYKARNARV